MKKKLLVAALFSVSATGAMAQANPFEGFNAGVSVSSVGSSTTLTLYGDSLNLEQQSMVPTLDVGYTYGVTKEFALGISATYDLADTKTGSVAGLNFKGKNHYSVNLKPGYVVGSSTMVYAILGYNSVKGQASFEGDSASTNFNGIGAGVGIAVLIDKNIYLKAEAQQITYNSKKDGDLTYKLSSTVGTIGIGYKF
jgi:opacity protein-like surface antigen